MHPTELRLKLFASAMSLSNSDHHSKQIPFFRPNLSLPKSLSTRFNLENYHNYTPILAVAWLQRSHSTMLLLQYISQKDTPFKTKSAY